MCEFCLKHGEGKKWYLRAENYSDDLLSDVRRRDFIADFVSDTSALRKSARSLNRLNRIPGFIKGLISRAVTKKHKKTHFGQVVPIEDIERIFEFVNSIVRVACICRHVTLGEEKRYCYGISLNPHGGEMSSLLNSVPDNFMNGPDMVGMEEISKAEAIASFREHEKEGLCHTVWTFMSPFIGGICNCDRTDCLAMRCTVTHDMPVMFRGEYVAHTDRDKCTGCRACMRVCQFGALTYSAASEKVSVDNHFCYGCGICRSVCPTDAIHLHDRQKVPAAAHLW